MKKLLIAILFLPIICQAQEVVKDTSWIQNFSGQYFKMRVIDYSNNNQSTEKTLIGTTGSASDVANTYGPDFSATTMNMARVVKESSSFRKDLTDIIQRNNEIIAAVGISPLDTIQAQQMPQLLAAGWKIRENGVVSDLVFSVNANGQARYKIGTAATKNATVFVSVIRFNAYPTTGTNMDFFRLKEGAYCNLDRTIFLLASGVTANAVQFEPSLQSEPKEPEPAPPAKVPTKKKEKKKG